MAKTGEMRLVGFLVKLTAILLLTWFSGEPVWGALVQENPGELVEGKTTGGFRYMSGGVSSEERESMQARARDYNLRLTFAAKSGAYVAGATLLIRDNKGNEIINAVTNGPWFFIDLPPGNYSVTATFERQSREIKNIRLSKGQTVRRNFYWDVASEPRPEGSPR